MTRTNPVVAGASAAIRESRHRPGIATARWNGNDNDDGIGTATTCIIIIILSTTIIIITTTTTIIIIIIIIIFRFKKFKASSRGSENFFQRISMRT